MFVLFLDDSVVAFCLYLCCLSGRTCVSLKEIAMIACNDDEPPLRGPSGARRGFVHIYSIKLLQAAKRTCSRTRPCSS